MNEKLKVAGVSVTTGGVELFVDCAPDDVHLMMDTGRNFALSEARKLGHAVNALSSEVGPVPVNKDNGIVLWNSTDMGNRQTAIKQAMDNGKLAYRKKFVLTFLGG